MSGFINWCRSKMNMDGPWICVTCNTWTLVKMFDHNGNRADQCITCGRGGCPCFDGIMESCDHHGHLMRRTLDEERALRMSRA